MLYGPDSPHTRIMKMKAVIYKGTKEVATENVDDAKIEKPTDVLVKITTTNICGSDLHLSCGQSESLTHRLS